MFYSLLLNAVLAFLSMFIVDFVNAIYIRHIQNDSAIASASTSVFIFLVHSVAIIGYVGNNMLDTCWSWSIFRNILRSVC